MGRGQGNKIGEGNKWWESNDEWGRTEIGPGMDYSIFFPITILTGCSIK